MIALSPRANHDVSKDFEMGSVPTRFKIYLVENALISKSLSECHLSGAERVWDVECVVRSSHLSFTSKLLHIFGQDMSLWAWRISCCLRTSPDCSHYRDLHFTEVNRNRSASPETLNSHLSTASIAMGNRLYTECSPSYFWKRLWIRSPKHFDKPQEFPHPKPGDS